MALFDVGTTLAGKYQIETVLGRGGMGLVLGARHQQLGQRVAIKVLSEESLAQPLLVKRFEQEARAAVQLKSVHVTRILDVGTVGDGVPYIVMEHLEGEDLASVLERGPLPHRQAVELVVQACEAIGEAHALGIVHRDLKPANLFVTRDVNGRALVKVLDFGISKVASESANHLTQTNAAMGTPYYMSPEQFRATRAADPRTDIWALGVTLYELLSGARPFEGDAAAEICTAVLRDPPAPLPNEADIPPEVVGTVMRCLEKDPAKRPASVDELVQALSPFASMPRIVSITTPESGVPRIVTPQSGVPRVATPQSGSTRIVTPQSGSTRIVTPQSAPRAKVSTLESAATVATPLAARAYSRAATGGLVLAALAGLTVLGFVMTRHAPSRTPASPVPSAATATEAASAAPPPLVDGAPSARGEVVDASAEVPPGLAVPRVASVASVKAASAVPQRSLQAKPKAVDAGPRHDDDDDAPARRR